MKTDRFYWLHYTAVLATVICLSLLSGCTAAPRTPPITPEAQVVSPSSPAPAARLNVMTHDSFAISEPVLAEFEAANNVKVQFLKSGDTGTALNKAILAKENPLADVFYGVDNTFLSRALAEGIFEAYDSPLLEAIPAEFQLDPARGALPVDYGDVCLNYDIPILDEKGLQPPASLEDLLKPEYESLLVVENPATSSPGLSFLLATIGHFGEDGYLDYWRGLVENDLLVVDGWETAYYTEFSGSAGRGPRPVVVSYNSSPVFELLFAEKPMEEPPTAAVVDPGTCFRQIEFVGILKGTQNLQLAQKWVDFMLSQSFQEDLPMQMFVFPVNPAAGLDETFQKFLRIPEQTVQVSPQMIAENREKWLNEWTETVLR
jgi:thiamine transport system substrate-binding protein